MSKPAAASYIYLKKKITNHFQIAQISMLCEDWGMSAQEVCYKLIFEGIHLEIRKRKEIADMVK